jgi:hypothetical protein
MSELVVGSLKGLSANGFVIDVASGSKLVQPGSVLQVVSVTKTDTFSTTSGTFADITGLSINITPVSTSSKIFITASLYGDNSAGDLGMIQLVRNSTPIGIGDTEGTRTRTTTAVGTFQINRPNSGSINFMDSPSSTSSTTYKLQMRVNGGTAFLNRPFDGTDNPVYPRTISTLTLMEIAG